MTSSLVLVCERVCACVSRRYYELYRELAEVRGILAPLNSVKPRMFTLLSVSVIFNCYTLGRIGRYFDTGPIIDTIAYSLFIRKPAQVAAA
jgi:hypothetical protein